MTNLRSRLIRLAHAKPELRPALLPLLKTGSFPRVVKEVEDDYRRKAITVGEKNELLAAIEDAETEQEAKKLVSDHRKGRVAGLVAGLPTKEAIQAKLIQIVKSVAKDALAFKASNSGGPEIRIKTYLDRPRLEFEFSSGDYGQSWGWGWNLGWDAAKDQVYLSSSNPQHHVDGKSYPISKVKAELQRRLDVKKQDYLRVVEKQREKALQEKAPEESSDQVWSVVTTGRDNGYASEVSTFDSKAAAEKAARETGNAYVVKGTQMWNEPLGQVEEHDRPSPSRFFP